MRDAHGEDNTPCRKRFPVIERKAKPILQFIQGNDKLIFQFWDQVIFEGRSIRSEGLNAHGCPRVGVLDPATSTKLLEGKTVIWIVDIRSEAVRFKHHAFGHMRSPAVHQAAEDTQAEPPASQVSSYGESVRSRAYDCSI